MASPPPARILIADDEPEVLDLIRQLLVHRGYEVAIANSGDEALRAVSAFRPDVLLVDWRCRDSRAPRCLPSSGGRASASP